MGIILKLIKELVLSINLEYFIQASYRPQSACKLNTCIHVALPKPKCVDWTPMYSPAKIAKTLGVLSSSSVAI